MDSESPSEAQVNGSPGCRGRHKLEGLTIADARVKDVHPILRRRRLGYLDVRGTRIPNQAHLETIFSQVERDPPRGRSVTRSGDLPRSR